LGAAIPPLNIPLVVGVTSHRNIAASEIGPIRERVRDFFAQLKRDFPELPLVVLSALAEGGDQLVAREALAAGAGLIAPLPLPPHSYADDFTDAASRAAFAELCQRADVVQLPSLPGVSGASIAVQGEARDRQYAQAGVFIASHSHILLALWDGRESDLLGGTAQVVRYHLSGAMPGLIERRKGSQVALDRGDESLIYHVVCSRTDRNGVVQPPLPPLQPLQTRWISSEHVGTAAAGMPDELRLMFTRMRQFNEDEQRYANDIRSETTQSAGDDDDSAGDYLLDGLFAAADWLALHFQKRVLLAMRGIFILAALMGIAFVCYSDLPTDLPYQDHGIYVFIVLFGAGVLLAWLARRRDWYRKYIDYRALAEGLRVQRWWRGAGIAATSSSAFAHDNFMQKQDIELGWIRNVMRAAGVHTIDDPATPESGLTMVISEWIGEPGSGGQLDYYTRKTEQRSRMHRMTQGLGRICLGIGIAISVFLALFQHRLGADNTTVLVAVMGVLAITAAARESYAYRKGDKELIKQYRYMRGIFAAARKKLDATRDAEDQREILRALGEAALAEHAEWALMHRERPLENARF
jgi:hypothetical protein